jgi:hypothetical protein
MNLLHTAGYMIQDAQGNAIYGIGSTVNEAWEMVADVVGSTFFDAYGDPIPADHAYATQFKTYGATAALITQVQAEGGAIAWGVVDGIACTVTEEEFAALYTESTQ